MSRKNFVTIFPCVAMTEFYLRIIIYGITVIHRPVFHLIYIQNIYFILVTVVGLRYVQSSVVLFQSRILVPAITLKLKCFLSTFASNFTFYKSMCFISALLILHMQFWGESFHVLLLYNIKVVQSGLLMLTYLNRVVNMAISRIVQHNLVAASQPFYTLSWVHVVSLGCVIHLEDSLIT